MGVGRREGGGHQRAVRSITSRVGDPFDDGEGGPGGWWILPGPGFAVADAPEVSPDVAGWRRDRLEVLPENDSIRVVPDWVCEILSPSTRRHDLLIKKPYYARIGVSHHWLVDRDARTLSAYALEGGRWVEIGVYGDERDARIAPFDSVTLDIASFWS